VYTDSHCHLIFPELQADLPGILQRMQQRQVTRALCVAVKLEEVAEIQSLISSHPSLYGSVGVHPSETDGEEPSVERLLALSRLPKVVAIGETGLDYYWHKGDTEWQRLRFRRHIEAARSARLPLIIHTREAAEDTIAILRAERAGEVGGVMHCFTETRQVAEAALEMGFYISFSGIVTFKNATALRDVAAMVPLERMLIETDAPYLAPTPYRGKTNEPSYVVHVAEEIARIKGVPADEIGRVTTENFLRLFKVSAAQ
jgi:TatD DNase family protein